MIVAGISRRLLARCLDEIVVVLAWLTAVAGLLIVDRATSRVPGSLPALALVAGAALALGLVLRLTYFVGFVGGCGQTPAQMLVGIGVVRRDGTPPGYSRALTRWLGAGLAWASLGLGFAIAMLDAEHRALPEWLSGTRVIRV